MAIKLYLFGRRDSPHLMTDIRSLGSSDSAGDPL